MKALEEDYKLTRLETWKPKVQTESLYVERESTCYTFEQSRVYILSVIIDCPKEWFCLCSRFLGQCRSDSKQGLRTLKDVTDCPKGGGLNDPPLRAVWAKRLLPKLGAWESIGHSRTSPTVLRLLRGMGALRALKDIPDCPKAAAWNGNP